MESSSESEDDAPPQDFSEVSDDLPISSYEDVKSLRELIRKVATALCFPYSELKKYVEDIVFDVVQHDVFAPVSLPLSSVRLQSIQNTWHHSSSALTLTKKLDHMYWVQEASAAFLYTHPKPNLLIVSSSSKGK